MPPVYSLLELCTLPNELLVIHVNYETWFTNEMFSCQVHQWSQAWYVWNSQAMVLSLPPILLVRNKQALGHEVQQSKSNCTPI